MVEHKVLGVYGRSLWFFLRHRWVSAVLWIACLGGTIYLFTVVPKAFLPVGDSSFLFGVVIAQEGTSPQGMRKIQTAADEAMHHNPAVEMTFSMTGNSQFLSQNTGLLLAFLSDPKGRAPIQAVSGQMAGAMMGTIPGVIAALPPQPVLQISTGATAHQSGQFAYTISGIDQAEVYDTSRKLRMKMFEFPGFQQPVFTDLYDKTPSLKIDFLREQAKLYGVSVSRIETLLRTAYSQNYVYLIKKADDQFQVILEAKDSQRTVADDLNLLYVRSDDGKTQVPLKAVAKWDTVLGPQSVNHMNSFTSVTLNFNLKPGVPISAATDFVDKAAAQIVPPTLRGSFQGEALTFKETVKSLVILMALAVFVMYVILGILYESYLHPITVLSSLPVALVGGLATLWIFGQEASLYAFIGMFMLMGIVKKNGIMIVDFARQRVNQGATAADAIHEASMDRFRPIIMTTLAAVMGALPIALGFGADGESRRPLGLVVVGGLIVSQFITLYVTPAIYLYLEEFQEKVLDRTSFFRSHHAAEQLAKREGVLAGELVEARNGNGEGNGHTN